MRTTLDVFTGLPIPAAQAAGQTYGVLARRESGKTYLVLKLEEQLCDAGIPFVVLDPVGKHYALRVGKDGSTKGGKPGVWVLGGLHGDVPLEAESGALIADTVVEHPGQYVLDVSTFETDAEQDRFALAFGERLFRRKAKDPGWPLLVILEEAESFIPQQPAPGQQRMLGAYGRIVRRGRNYGLGMVMVAQRAAALNKGVLSQVEVLIVKQMSHNRDIDAVDAWVKAQGDQQRRDELVGALATLKREEAYVWSPTWLDAFRKVRVKARVTFDSSATPEHGQHVAAVELSPLDVQALGERIAATAERAKADDPRELKRRIRELEHDYRTLLNQSTERETVEVPVEIEVEAIPEAIASGVKVAQETLARMLEQLHEATTGVSDVHGGLIVLRSDIERHRETPPTRITIPDGAARTHDIEIGPALERALQEREVEDGKRPPFPQPRPTPVAVDASNGEVKIEGIKRDVLETLASFHPRELTARQLGTLIGKSPEGGYFRRQLGELRSAGLLDELRITDAGLATVPRRPPPTREEAIDLWRQKLSGIALEAFDLIAAGIPAGMSDAEIAAALNKAPEGGYFRRQLGSLRSNGLVVKRDGRNYLSPDFDAGA